MRPHFAILPLSFLSLLIVTSAATALAANCPDIAGHWLCTYSNNQPKQTISFQQSPVPGGMLYTLTTQTGRVEEILVDGVTRSKISSRGWVQHETYSCIDAASFGESSDLISSEGITVVTRTGNVVLADANTLKGDRKTSVPWSSGPVQTEELTFECERR